MKKTPTILAVAGMIVLGISLTLPAGEKLDAVQSKIRRIWKSLDETQSACKSFDYFPGGGMRSFACHLKSLTSLDFLLQASGLPIFRHGPHRGSKLKLDERYRFGHYNPDFVRWMTDNLIPAAGDAAFRKATRKHYDEYVKPLARIFYVTWHKARREPECFDREVGRYQSLMQQKKLPEAYYERFFYFMNPEFCAHADEGFDYFYGHGFDGGYSGNVVKTCVAFWIRRTIDGTADEFYRGLHKLIETYDPGLLGGGKR